MSWRFAAATVSASASQRQSLVDVVTAAMMPPGLSKLQQKSWEKKQIKLRRRAAERKEQLHQSRDEMASEMHAHLREVGWHPSWPVLSWRFMLLLQLIKSYLLAWRRPPPRLARRRLTISSQWRSLRKVVALRLRSCSRCL